MNFNPWRGVGALPKEIWILFTTTLINRSGMMAFPFLILYLVKGLHFSNDDSALILVLYGIGAAIMGPIAGRLSDRIGAERVMTLSLFGAGIALLAFPLAQSFWQVAAATVLWAMLSEAFRPASLATVSHMVPPEQLKAAFAVNRLGINIGMSIGPAAGGFIAMVSYPALFWVNGAVSLIAGIICLLAPWKVVSHLKRVEGQPKPTGVRPYRDVRLVRVVIAVLLVMIVFFQSDSTLPLFVINDLGYSEAWFGMLFTINTVIIIFLEIYINLKMSHWTHRRSLTWGALLIGFGFGAMALSPTMVMAMIGVTIWTFGEMILFPGSAAYVSEIAPPAQRGEYMGYYQMTFSLGFIIGPWTGLQVYEHFGPMALWVCSLAVGIIAAIILSRVNEEMHVFVDDREAPRTLLADNT